MASPPGFHADPLEQLTRTRTSTRPPHPPHPTPCPYGRLTSLAAFGRQNSSALRTPGSGPCTDADHVHKSHNGWHRACSTLESIAQPRGPLLPGGGHGGALSKDPPRRESGGSVAAWDQSRATSA